MLPALPTGMQSASGASPEVVAHLEGAGLLPLQAVRVERVDQRDRMALDQLAHRRQRLVEAALQGEHAGPVDQRLGQLAGGDLPSGITTAAEIPARAA